MLFDMLLDKWDRMLKHNLGKKNEGEDKEWKKDEEKDGWKITVRKIEVETRPLKEERRRCE
jgi:hypothetical protein